MADVDAVTIPDVGPELEPAEFVAFTNEGEVQLAPPGGVPADYGPVQREIPQLVRVNP